MDLCVTCPKDFWLKWIEEGDPAGSPPSTEEWAWFMGGPRPPIGAGDRLYVVAWGALRGWAPVTRLARKGSTWAICRRGGAVACTIPLLYSRSAQAAMVPPDAPAVIDGFRGFRRVWWPRPVEVPFPDWMTYGVAPKLMRQFLRAVGHNRAPVPQVQAALNRIASEAMSGSLFEGRER